MIEAPIPANESARLAALEKTQLLDTPLEERFERITRLVCRLLGVPRASISLVDQTRQWFKSIQGSDLTETPRQISFCAHAILEDEIMIVPDAKKDVRFADNPLVTGPEQVIFYAGHPLKAADGSRIGVLCAIDSKPREFTEDDLTTLRDLAALAETELRSTTLVDTQRELLSQLSVERRRALIDPLTRLWNRDGIMEILRREYERALRDRQHLGVLMADIDYFKRINDEHGHPVGDSVLREVAKRLLTSFRSTDAVGRVGGEEFLVVMPVKPAGTDIETVASTVCRHIGQTDIETTAGHLSLTISIGGVLETFDFNSDVEALIKQADDALYRAKKMGRNRTVIFNSEESQCAAAQCA
ncbi:MAG TPA: sensor domain-containing diguanylate cyclase [Tepidisphaeraceae bacterium]|jgi:diguanylate cyclase (GGDEF)-like protein